MLALAAATAALSRSDAADAPGDFEPLFDGRTLKGWVKSGGGSFLVRDGALRATQEAEQPDHGVLLSDAYVKDFTLRLKFKAVRGNSGVYFRCELRPDHAVKVAGMQAEIDAASDVGGLYETLGRGWIVQPPADRVRTWFRAGDWNELTVSARGGDIVVHVNGAKTAELKEDPGRREGYLGLQVHGGQDVEVWFKDIELARPAR